MQKKSLITIGSSVFAIATTASMAIADVNQPQEIIMRPLTTPAGQITVGGDVGFLIIPDVDMGIGLSLGGRYGVSDKIEAGASYGFSLKEFEAKGSLTLEGAYNIMEGNLAVAANASFGYDVEGSGLEPLALGARVRFRLNDKMAVYSPGGQLSIALEEQIVPPATTGATPITLGLPVGFQYQASPQINAFLQTSLANIKIADSANAFLFADFIPLSVGAFFSPSNTMDFGGSVSWIDLKEFSDILVISASARLHM